MFHKEKIDEAVNLVVISKLNVSERVKTVDWISTIAFNFKLRERTLGMAIECFDFYLERNSNSFNHDNYQFLGLSCLFLASKYEEIYPPNIQVNLNKYKFL